MSLDRKEATFICYGEEERVVLEETQYPNKRLAIVAYSLPDGMPFCKLTVNMVDEEVAPNQFFVKNGGAEYLLAEKLEEMGLIRRLNIHARSSFVERYATLWEMC